jgi:hypothetical protein
VLLILLDHIDLNIRKIRYNVLVIFSSEATPLPIPNREVKLASTDDSLRAKVGDRRNFVPNFFVVKIYFF